MMNNQRWTTKEEVLQDLATVTDVCMLDDGDYIIGGSQPPPQRRDSDYDDGEYQLLFGGGGGDAPLEGGKQEPDLVGITQMLRMVEDTSDSRQRMDWTRNLCSNPSGDNAAILITKALPTATQQNWRERTSPRSELTNPPPFTWGDRKFPRTNLAKDNAASSNLNPEVPCFVPRVAPNVVPTATLTNDVNGIMAASVSNDHNETINSQTNKSVTSKKSAYEEKALAEILKKKIVDANKADKKKEKNVAIAALLKLNTTPRGSVASSSSQSLNSIKDSTGSINKEIPVKTIKPLTYVRESESPNNVILFTPKYFETNVEMETKKSESSPIDIELQKKVIDWINDTKSEIPSPKPEKSPIKPRPKLQLITKPIGFIKKSVNPMVKSFPQSSNIVSGEIPRYVPTRNASKLAQHYEETMKEDEKPAQNCGFLTEAFLKQLKAKDEEFKTKCNKQNGSVEPLTRQRRRR